MTLCARFHNLITHYNRFCEKNIKYQKPIVVQTTHAIFKNGSCKCLAEKRYHECENSDSTDTFSLQETSTKDNTMKLNFIIVYHEFVRMKDSLVWKKAKLM